MFLKQLTSTRRNADVVRLARFYGSPAVCESVTVKASRKLSRDDRRVLVESFVNKYRAANDGKFPSYSATQKAVGGSYSIVKVLLQELKLKPEAPLPIVAKALSEGSACEPDDALNDSHSHVSACIAKEPLPTVAKALLEDSISLPHDASSQTVIDTDTDPQSHSAKHFSATVVDPVLQAGTVETGSFQRRATIDSSYSDEVNLTAAAHDKKETETASNNDVNSKCDLLESQMVIEECLQNAGTGKGETLSHLGSEEAKEDSLEGATVSENIEHTVIRQDSEKGVVQVEREEKPSAWGNIMSFAKEFANFWRKG